MDLPRSRYDLDMPKGRGRTMELPKGLGRTVGLSKGLVKTRPA